MSFLKKPFQKLKGLKESSSDKLSDTDTGSGTDGNGTNGATNGNTKSGTNTPDDRRRSQELLRGERIRRSMDKERLKAEEKKRLTLARIESENFMQHGPPDLTKLYRPYSMNMSKNWNHENRILFKEIDFESKHFSPVAQHLLTG